MKRRQYLLAAVIMVAIGSMSSIKTLAAPLSISKTVPSHMGPAVVSFDSLYYESSREFGSGKTAFITAGTKVVVNGVSYLQHDSETDSYQIEMSLYVPYNLIDTHVPLGENYSMLHLCTEDGQDLGWVIPEVFSGFDGCPLCPHKNWILL